MPPRPRRVRIVEQPHFISDLESLADDFPAIDELRQAIRARLSRAPTEGHQIQKSPDVFISVITGVGGAPTFRYMWRREQLPDAEELCLIAVDRVLPQLPPF